MNVGSSGATQQSLYGAAQAALDRDIEDLRQVTSELNERLGLVLNQPDPPGEKVGSNDRQEPPPLILRLEESAAKVRQIRAAIEDITARLVI